MGEHVDEQLHGEDGGEGIVQVLSGASHAPQHVPERPEAADRNPPALTQPARRTDLSRAAVRDGQTGRAGRDQHYQRLTATPSEGPIPPPHPFPLSKHGCRRAWSVRPSGPCTSPTPIAAYVVPQARGPRDRSAWTGPATGRVLAGPWSPPPPVAAVLYPTRPAPLLQCSPQGPGWR